MRYSLIALIALVGCASQPTTPPMSLQQIASMPIDCNNREQVRIIEEELARRRFYTVEGVVGNESPDRISKQFYTYSRYKIWSIRTACPQSR